MDFPGSGLQSAERVLQFAEALEDFWAASCTIQGQRESLCSWVCHDWGVFLWGGSGEYLPSLSFDSHGLKDVID